MRQYYCWIHYKYSGNGKDVEQLQIILKKLGYFAYPQITGYFGALTKDAVVQFQKANNLAPYPGSVGSATRSVLNELVR